MVTPASSSVLMAVDSRQERKRRRQEPDAFHPLRKGVFHGEEDAPRFVFRSPTDADRMVCCYQEDVLSQLNMHTRGRKQQERKEQEHLMTSSSMVDGYVAEASCLMMPALKKARRNQEVQGGSSTAPSAAALQIKDRDRVLFDYPDQGQGPNLQKEEVQLHPTIREFLDLLDAAAAAWEADQQSNDTEEDEKKMGSCTDHTSMDVDVAVEESDWNQTALEAAYQSLRLC